ncbi:hypothetical protein TSTA_034530 [Talaromyces stipitatus ATCC 10500]|uniref:Uncharacterized protein n=1 Tax=Talaromyces stipitatus (strain ATCC 10500 / CBS 375.48 / QM 6759 / NRRL 1006) TaxID=441959 RepID=B8M6Z5_TALSN|nr:uncharacterized protein TSTA_034530 [Talaromyces stipitatus ATCC 10500]EED20215.1 hypothetical protein TSTA_034530 [Talaromyces stipitatus ATCC 10500]
MVGKIEEFGRTILALHWIKDAIIDNGNTLKIYGDADDTIPSSPTIKSISPSSIQKLRRYVNIIEKSIDRIKDILDEAIPGLARRIETFNQGSFIMADLGELHRESFAKAKRQVKAVDALYVKDANRLIKRRHDGDLLKIHKQYVLDERQPEEEEVTIEPQNLVIIYKIYGVGGLQNISQILVVDLMGHDTWRQKITTSLKAH